MARGLLEAFDLIEATKSDSSFNRAARPVAELAPLPSWQDVDLDAAVQPGRAGHGVLARRRRPC
eukprot:3166626-Pleurochrysis_carterae.AAC.1